MSLTFTISDGVTPVAFGAMSVSNGRKAMSMSVNSPSYSKQQFSLPGVDGIYVVRGGKRATQITAMVRYVGASVTAAEALYTSDKAAFANVALTITDPSATVYTRCELVENGMVRQGEIRPTGRTAGQVRFDVLAQFEVLT